jgi:hypothetical protein
MAMPLPSVIAIRHLGLFVIVLMAVIGLAGVSLLSMVFTVDANNDKDGSFNILRNKKK